MFRYHFGPASVLGRSWIIFCVGILAVFSLQAHVLVADALAEVLFIQLFLEREERSHGSIMSFHSWQRVSFRDAARSLPSCPSRPPGRTPASPAVASSACLIASAESCDNVHILHIFNTGFSTPSPVYYDTFFLRTAVTVTACLPSHDFSALVVQRNTASYRIGCPDDQLI